MVSGPTEAIEYTIELIESHLSRAVADRGRATIVLSGGSTPRPVYAGLRKFAGIQEVEWIVGDERLVEAESDDSNLTMIAQTLFDRLNIAQNRRHSPDLQQPVEGMLSDYSRQVEALLAGDPDGCFDLALLGLGADGHTASLFPNDAKVDARELVVLGQAPLHPTDRISLSARALSRARQVVFLVLGSSKAEAVRRSLTASPDAGPPGSWVRAEHGRTLWLVDAEAASQLDSLVE